MALKRWLALVAFLLPSLVQAQGGIFTPGGSQCKAGASAPVTCTVATEGRCYTNTGDNLLYYCNGTSFVAVAVGSSGASTALDNLASVNINSALLFQTGIGIGSTAAPVKNIVMNLSGTYGTGSFTWAGTPTANRTLTLPDVTDTMMVLGANQTVSGAITFSNTSTGTVWNSNAPLYFGASSTAKGGIVRLNSSTTTPTGLLFGSESNSWLLIQNSNASFNYLNGPCASAACADPTLIGFSHNQNTSQYWSIAHDGTNAVITTGAGALKLSPNSGVILYDGTKSATALRFGASASAGYGFYAFTSNWATWSVNGTDTLSLTNNANDPLVFRSDMRVSWTSSASINQTLDAGFGRDGTNRMKVTNGSTGYGDLAIRHTSGAGSAPTVTAGGCTSPTVTGTDMSGEINVGTGCVAQTTITITFATAFAAAPNCIVADRTTGGLSISWTPGTATLAITDGTAMVSSDKYVYICMGV